MCKNDKEFNLLKEVPDLEKAVFNQKDCRCCWAITVATVLGYLYHNEATEDGKFELSPQDILDRVWLYYKAEVGHKRRDKAGCYTCSVRLGYTYAKHFGVGFLDKYPFKATFDGKKGGVDKKTEFPRVFTGDYQKLETVQEVIKTLKEEKKAVTASIAVTRSFVNYKKDSGVYKHPPGVVASSAAASSTTPGVLGRHLVVIVGVNEEDGYFIIRNSWGEGWGDNGYGKVEFAAFWKFTTASSAFAKEYP